MERLPRGKYDRKQLTNDMLPTELTGKGTCDNSNGEHCLPAMNHFFKSLVPSLSLDRERPEKRKKETPIPWVSPLITVSNHGFNHVYLNRAC